MGVSLTEAEVVEGYVGGVGWDAKRTGRVVAVRGRAGAVGAVVRAVIARPRAEAEAGDALRP